MKYAALPVLLILASCGRPSGPDVADLARASAHRHSAEAMQVLDLVGQRIEEFFSKRRPGVEAFSNELFSFRGKWRALFWSREDFERHVRRRFEATLFRPEDFDREVVAAVREDLAFAIDASEAGLASDLSRWVRPSRKGDLAVDLKPELSKLVASRVLEDLGLNLASIVGSEAAATAGTAALARAGLLGAAAAGGAGASWATLGVSLVVGVAVGLVIDATVGDELEEEAKDAIRVELARLRRRMMEEENGLWNAARRVLESHGRAMERSAVRLVEESRHGARGV